MSLQKPQSSMNHPKPFRAMATPKAGSEGPKKNRGRNFFGIGLLMFVLVSGSVLSVLLIRGHRLQAKAIPTSTLSYIGLASPGFTATATVPAASTKATVSSPEPSPTHTTEPSSTPTIAPSPTPTETSRKEMSPSPSAYPFIIRNNSQLSHEIYFPNESCEKSVFIAGQVLDYTEKDIIGYVVVLSGIHGGKEIYETSETGSMPVFGPSGFGFVLPNDVQEDDEVTIQLFDDEGRALSKKITLELSGACDKNLRLIRYKQTSDL